MPLCDPMFISALADSLNGSDFLVRPRGALPDSHKRIQEFNQALAIEQSSQVDNHGKWISLTQNISMFYYTLLKKKLSHAEFLEFKENLSRLDETGNGVSDQSTAIGTIRSRICGAVENHLLCLIGDHVTVRHGLSGTSEKEVIYHDLCQRMLTAFMCGGFPCGWEGGYPDGRMAVYWPFDEQGNPIPQEVV
jgi:hypothetical protein